MPCGSNMANFISSLQVLYLFSYLVLICLQSIQDKRDGAGGKVPQGRQ